MQSVNIKGSAIELLDVMLEKTDEKSEDLVRDIANNLDIEALHHTLVEFYELKNDQEVKDNGYDDEAEAGLFRTYHALVHLTDYEVSKEKIGESSSKISQNQYIMWAYVPLIMPVPGRPYHKSYVCMMIHTQNMQTTFPNINQHAGIVDLYS